MRIGLNAQILTDGRTGVTRYAHNVIKLLPKLGQNHEFVVFGNSPDLKYDEHNVIIAKTQNGINSASKRILWEQTVLPRLAKKWKLDLMFYPDHTSSLWSKKITQAIVLHDLAPFALPRTFNRLRRGYKQYAIAHSIQAAKIILAVSYATKAEALRYFPGIENKINVVYPGLEHSIERVKDRETLSKIRKQYSLRDPFLLFIGTLEARKNVLRLIKAFAQGRRKYGWKHNLVLAGAAGYGYQEIERVINEEQVQDNITVTGYIKDSELSSFYSLADIFIYPSLYEGFGFPPLEAMKCECPVIVSNSTSLPETIGEAGLYIDPYDEASIIAQIHCLIQDKILKKNLIQKGKERSLQFTWEKTVQNILNVIIQA
jgi:glycosyltransferase involved in cell wall biosynthesis